MKPRLSLCMIVRDTEALIPEFLAHLDGLWDQWVVVDTGSIDQTPALLAAAGAEVHHLPWRDDFALARNESLHHATGDWILVLDSDEFPEPGFAAEVRSLIENPAVGAATLPQCSLQPQGGSRTAHPLRLFRNLEGIRYRYRIHEDPTESVQAALAARGLGFARLTVPVRHVGYLPQQMKGQNKRGRDERLLALAIAEDPTDLYSRYKLLELYRFWGEVAAMVPLADECRLLVEAGIAIEPPHIAGDLAEMVAEALHHDDPAEAGSFLVSWAPYAESCGRFHIALATRYEALGQIDQAFAAFEQGLRLAEGDPSWVQTATRALGGLTRLALGLGEMALARQFAEAAAQMSPDDAEIRLALDFLATLPDPA